MLLFTLHKHQLLQNDVLFDSFISHGISLLVVFRESIAHRFLTCWCMRNIWHIASVVYLVIFYLLLNHLHRTFVIWALKEIVIFLTIRLILLGLVYELFSGCSKLALYIFDTWWIYHVWRITVSLLLLMKSQRLIRLIQSSNLVTFLIMANLSMITLAFTLCHAQRILIWIIVNLFGSVIIAHDGIIIIDHWRLTSISGSSISWIRYLFSTSLSLR